MFPIGVTRHDAFAKHVPYMESYLYQNRVVLKDNKRNRIAEVMLKEGELQCLLDERELIVYMLALLIHFLNYIIMRLKFPLISKWRYVLTFPKKVGSEKRFVSMFDLEENAAPNFLFTD